MSSLVARKDRTQRAARTALTEFSTDEQKIIASVRTWFPGPVVVFGSRARGNWAADSDLDLGVTGYRYSIHKPVLARINEWSPIKVDLFDIQHAATHRKAVKV